MAVPQDLQSRFQSYYQREISQDATVTNMQALANGWETDVFAFDLHTGAQTHPLILRVYSGGASAVLRARNEYHVMKTLHAATYPVPPVLHFQPDSSHLGGCFLIMERAPGSPLQSQLTERLDQFCRLLFDLHQVDWRPFVGDTSPWPTLREAEATYGREMLTLLVARYGLTEPFAPLFDWLTRRQESITTRPAVIHGDYHPYNVLVDQDGTPAVIDWGSTCITDPRADVANAMMTAHALGLPELALAIQHGYEALAGGALQDMGYFHALVLTRRFAVMFIAMVRGAAEVGLRSEVEQHLRANVQLFHVVLDSLTGLTGLNLSELRQVLATIG